MTKSKQRPSHSPRQRLAQARILRGWSQREVAEQVGTNHVNVSRWERGMTDPYPHFRHKLCELFGKSEQELDLIPQIKEQHLVIAPPGERLLAAAPHSESDFAMYDPAIPLRSPIPLMGRETVLDSLVRRLCMEVRPTLTAINGLPGMGKTALALEIAYHSEVRACFRDGILWADLGPTPNRVSLFHRWGMLVGLSSTKMATLSTSEEWLLAFRHAIGTRSWLIVLDDVWQIEDAFPLIVGGPNCAHLITTRFPSVATHVAPGGALELEALSDEESLALLCLFAPGVAQEEQKLHNPIRAVGGLPLALTLMGYYLRKQAYHGQSRRIRAALEQLNQVEVRLNLSEPRGLGAPALSSAMGPSVSLHSVIALSELHLQEHIRTAFYALSVLPAKPESFSEETALAVASCSFETLYALSDAGLLESRGEDRYTIHQVLIDYAHLHLHETEPYKRLIARVLSLLEKHKLDYEALDQESSSILAALEAASTLENKAELIQIVCNFIPFLLVRNNYALAERSIERAYEAASALQDQQSIIQCLLYRGRIVQRQGNDVLAEGFFQEALYLAQQIEAPERADALLYLGRVARRRGRYVQAEAYLQEGLALTHQMGNRECRSDILEELGTLFARRGEYAQAERYQKEGLVLTRQFGDQERLCRQLENLGLIVNEQGKYVQAEEYCRESLVLARQIGHHMWIISLLTNLSDLAIVQENYMRAEEYLREGLTLARQIDLSEWLSALLINEGLLERKRGNYDRAKASLQESLILARHLNIPHITACGLYENGNLSLEEQQIDAAHASFREMLTLVPEGARDLLALAQYGLARVAFAQGKAEEARALITASLEVLETIGHRDAREVRKWFEANLDLLNR